MSVSQRTDVAPGSFSGDGGAIEGAPKRGGSGGSSSDLARVLAGCAVPGVLFVAAIVIGAMGLGEPWGIPALTTGAAGMLVTIAAVVVRQPAWSLFGLTVIGGMGCVWIGVEVGMQGGGGPAGWALIAAGTVGLLMTGVAMPIWWELRRRNGDAEMSGGGSNASAGAAVSDVVAPLLREIHTHTMLSDNAKRVLFRDHEVQMLREAIESDIECGDFNAGLTHCDALGDLFGFREEAEAYRSRILQIRDQEHDAKVRQALEQLDAHLERRDWATAYREAARIRRLYPDSHLVDHLEDRILRAREEHKADLEQKFLDAAQRDDAESAMEWLRELDRYLTPEEAGRLAEVAQGVVVKHRENLGAQFKIAVRNHEWTEAVYLGQSIIDEFPNSKMADEVRSVIDKLRARATQSPTAQMR